MKNSTLAPTYVPYREGITATDTVFNDKSLGLNTGSFEYLNIQVLPSGDADVGVSVYAWSESAEKFVIMTDVDAVAGQGENVGYEFTIRAAGRIVLVAATFVAAEGAADIYTSTFDSSQSF